MFFEYKNEFGRRFMVNVMRVESVCVRTRGHGDHVEWFVCVRMVSGEEHWIGCGSEGDANTKLQLMKVDWYRPSQLSSDK